MDANSRNCCSDLFPFLPRGSLCNASGYFKPKLMHMVLMLSTRLYFLLRDTQFQGVDYIDTFALVAKMDSIILVLAIAASKGWKVHHMDVKSALLHDELRKYIYIFM